MAVDHLDRPAAQEADERTPRRDVPPPAALQPEEADARGLGGRPEPLGDLRRERMPRIGPARHAQGGREAAGIEPRGQIGGEALGPAVDQTVDQHDHAQTAVRSHRAGSIAVESGALPSAPRRHFMTATSSGSDENAAALGQYLSAIRARKWVVLAVTLATLAVAVPLLAMRTASYESTAQLLVTPLPQDDRTFLGTALLRDSGDPTRTVQTAAALLSSPLAAADAARRLGGGETAGDVQQHIDVQPLGDSNILSITASAGSPAAATRLADQYVRSALAVRRAELDRQLDAAIDAIGPKPTGSDIARLGELRTVRESGDPTITRAQPAQTPHAASGAPTALVLVLAVIAGFTLGSIAALLMERFDRRVRDSGELPGLAPIPIMLRVPKTGARAIAPRATSLAWSVREAFRTLQIELDRRRADAGGGNQTVMVTSASSADGKTSTALNLAFALVGAGHRVILMDCDLRRPDIARQLGLTPSNWLVALLTSRVPLERPAPAGAGEPPGARGRKGLARQHTHARARAPDRRDPRAGLRAGRLRRHRQRAARRGRRRPPHRRPRGRPAARRAPATHQPRGAAGTRSLLQSALTRRPAGWVVIGEDGARPSSSYYAEANGSGRRLGRIRSLSR